MKEGAGMDSPRRFSHWAQGELEEIRAADRWRATVAFDGESVAGRVGARDMISFASNDYLGLSSHTRVRAAAIEAVERLGGGSSASRLITGTRSLHHELEAALAQWKGTPRALLFSTGYAANLGVLQVFGAADVTIFSDELNHASIIDGCRLSRARARVFRHNDMAHLRQLLETTPGRRIVVTEAVFSMDGDAAPLQALGELCALHGALLIVDEAHSVLGPEWPLNCTDLEYLRLGTLSKTLGSLGGWVAGSADMIDLLVNRARTFIFTTAPTPANTAAALAALSVYRSEEGAALRARLRSLIDLLRPGHPSAILPYILGENARAIDAARQLFGLGVYVPAIRPPTVPVGTARLRVALSAAHTQEMVLRLRDALTQLGAG
ncbi:8-amino-7-oxononanoate synthase [Steroidobacter denitrificans]|uniref:8-amino-7-oxononanoate synthase n=2 Tax=Steroidobacter denitrificans TaxID=465721 RepID=A0A127FB49_STEDE|nr:8-amino-7-oxononanoate synthase [Steroidobacter denitrificans]